MSQILWPLKGDKIDKPCNAKQNTQIYKKVNFTSYYVHKHRLRPFVRPTATLVTQNTEEL